MNGAPSVDSRWLGFWSGKKVKIYVNQAHLEAHYRRLFADLSELLPKDPGFILLDYGCGDALMAPGLVERGANLILHDRSPAAQERLRARYAGTKGVTILDEAGFAALAPESADVVLVISVIQYMAEDSFRETLARWRDLLKPGAQLILADVLPPESNALADAWALLRFGLANGFFWAAFFGLFATFFNEYRTLRSQLGLKSYSEAEMLAKLSAAGFAPKRAAKNIGSSPHRMTFVARKPQ